MELIITSALAFMSTNIDDIFILILFYGNKKFKDLEILTGQFLGILTLITISLIGSLVGLFIDQAYVGLLGLVPIYLGVRGIWRLLSSELESDQANDLSRNESRSNVLTVAGVTVANGGDNIGIYIQLFATLTWTHKLSMVTVFLVMTFLWCMIAKYLTKHPYISKSVDKYGHLITPFVLVLLGLYILYQSKTLRLFIN